ncbi:MAG: hypothetical protein M3O20_05935 [Acidobacteriota bacterium]|nr:hypothetical protein [Acidobacteriota bacterium]
MSDEQVLLRKGKLMDDFVAAKTKFQMLQDEGRREAKILEGIVEFLRTGGAHGQISMGVPPETYLSVKLATLISDLRTARQERDELRERLSSMGLPVTD